MTLKNYVLGLIFLCVGLSGQAQNHTWSGNITLSNQEEIDRFMEEYQYVTKLENSLIIEGSNLDDMTNLLGLSKLTEIKGNLIIKFTDIATLEGLHNLTNIGGDIIIEANFELVDITALANIDHQYYLDNLVEPKVFRIKDNTSLTSCNIDLLCGYYTYGGKEVDFRLFNNGEGCNSELEVVTNCNASPEQDYIFYEQNQIDNFAQNHPGVTTIEGNVRISTIGDSSITSMAGLAVLTTIGGDLLISNNSGLTSLTGLEQIESIGGTFYIENNASIASLSEISQITSLGGMSITAQPNLSTLDDFPVVETLEESLKIIDCDGLQDFSGLENLTWIGDQLIVAENDNLQSIEALNNLEVGSFVEGPSLGPSIVLKNNPDLELCKLDALCGLVANLDGYDAQLRALGNSIACNGGSMLYDCDDQTEDFLVFRSQAEIDAFPTNFPDLTTVTRYLYIEDADGTITNLDALQQLTSIGTDITIINCEALANIDGLDNLTSVGGDFIIEDAEALEAIDGLNNLVSIGGDFYCKEVKVSSLAGLNNLTSLGGAFALVDVEVETIDGVSNLEVVGSHLRLEKVGALTMISGLNNLTTIEGSLVVDESQLTTLATFADLASIGEDINISNNPNITTLINFPESTVYGNLIINGNENVENLEQLATLTSIGKDLKIGSNSSLATLAGCENITIIGHSLIVLGNSNLEDMNNFDQLITVGENIEIAANEELPIVDFSVLEQCRGDLLIKYNASLTAVEDILTLTKVDGHVEIQGNSSLVSFDGLNGLNEIVKKLVVKGHFMLDALDGFQNLETIKGSLEIWQNDANMHLIGLENLVSIGDNFVMRENNINTITGLGNLTTIGKNFQLIDNPAIQTTVALTSLTSIGWGADIINNGALTTLALPSLVSIGARLSIKNNDSLVDLTEMSTLTSVSGGLNIGSNDILASLDGLDNIDGTQISYLSILSNSQLTVCAIESVCAALEDDGVLTTIFLNASPCSTVEEVEEQCTVDTDDLVESVGVTIAPNPAHIQFVVTTTSNEVIDQVKVYDVLGREVQRSTTAEVDIQHLEAGLYTVIVEVSNRVEIKKLIVE